MSCISAKPEANMSQIGIEPRNGPVFWVFAIDILMVLIFINSLITPYFPVLLE